MHTPWIWKISRNDCLRFLDSHGCTGLYRSSFGFGARRRGSPSERGLYANSSPTPSLPTVVDHPFDVDRVFPPPLVCSACKAAPRRSPRICDGCAELLIGCSSWPMLLVAHALLLSDTGECLP